MSARPGTATLLALPGFALLFVALLIAALQSGSAGPLSAAAVWQGLAAAAGFGDPLDGAQQVILAQVLVAQCSTGCAVLQMPSQRDLRLAPISGDGERRPNLVTSHRRSPSRTPAGSAPWPDTAAS